jgi:hypothetical protein
LWNKKNKVIKRTKLFWKNLFQIKQIKPIYTLYWLKKKSKLMWKSKEITKKIQLYKIRQAIENMGNNKTVGIDNTKYIYQ